jgi:hypothetical protein
MSRILSSATLAALLLLLPGLGAAGQQESGEAEQPLPGELVLPEEMRGDDSGEEKKQCMTVCARWGEECILVNRGAGGMERKCRRTCQQFAEECF